MFLPVEVLLDEQTILSCMHCFLVLLPFEVVICE